MLHLYLNYPNPRAVAHPSAGCGQIRKHKKQGQRVRRVSRGETGLAQIFADTFAPNATENDMWVEIDLDDSEREGEVAQAIVLLLGVRWSRLGGVEVETHDCRDAP